jgi:hypothetical protein
MINNLKEIEKPKDPTAEGMHIPPVICLVGSKVDLQAQRDVGTQVCRGSQARCSVATTDR